MGITSALWTGISGLYVHSQATSVVSNNLANSSTTGYKSQSTNFEDVFYSTVSTGSGGDQIGNGASVANVTTDFTQGSYLDSGVTTNLALGGNGYFIVEDVDTETTYYTRAGTFDFDDDGFLVDAHGNRVQGWAMDEGSISGSVTDIVLDQQQSPPSATTSITASLNLNSTDTSQSNDATASNAGNYFATFSAYNGTQSPALDSSYYSATTTTTIYDENGLAHDVSLYMDPVDVDADGNIVWEYVAACSSDEDMRTVDGVDLNGTEAAGILMTGTLTFTSSGEISSMTGFTLSEPLTNASDLKDPANWTLADLNDDGQVVMSANFTGTDTDLDIGFDFGLTSDAPASGWSNPSSIGSLADITTATTYSDLPTFTSSERSVDATTSYAKSSEYYLIQDGYAPGSLLNVSVDENGVMSGSYSNGQIIELYTVALADFNNSGGLYAEGNNLFSATTASGTPRVGQANTSGFGSIYSNTLEGSNVDMATEMANLIVLQSAYSANSKIVTTANTMLETALSMKR